MVYNYNQVGESGAIFMLLGTFEHNLDNKLRLTIPSKLRNKLGESLIVSKSIEHCLEIRTLDSFEK